MEKEASLYFNSQFLYTDLISICYNDGLMDEFCYPLKIPTTEEYSAYKRWRLGDFIGFFLKNAKLNAVQKECVDSLCEKETCFAIEKSVEMLSEVKISFDDERNAIVFNGKKALILIIENVMNKFLNEVSFTYQQFCKNKKSIESGIAFLQPYASNELSCFIQMWVYEKLKER